jgi:hypothetical protein
MKGRKMRKNTQAAFFQPEVSWSRKRSLMIVIRIQMKITRKKIERTVRSAWPSVYSAIGTDETPLEMSKTGRRLPASRTCAWSSARPRRRFNAR